MERLVDDMEVISKKNLDKLIEMGAKEGDQVRILDFYFDFKE